jgi:hypothetical protein
VVFREVDVVEVREVLRGWLDGVGLRAVAARAGLQTVASRVRFREQYRALVGHALVWARVLLLLRALSVPGDTV